MIGTSFSTPLIEGSPAGDAHPTLNLQIVLLKAPLSENPKLTSSFSSLGERCLRWPFLIFSFGPLPSLHDCFPDSLFIHSQMDFPPEFFLLRGHSPPSLRAFSRGTPPPFSLSNPPPFHGCSLVPCLCKTVRTFLPFHFFSTLLPPRSQPFCPF